MSDKQPNPLVDIPFTAGEQPTADKLTAVTAQLKTTVSDLGGMIGDPRGVGYRYNENIAQHLTMSWGIGDTGSLHGATLPLNIANLARLIGPASALNPRMLESSTQVQETIPAGVTFYKTKYPIDTGSAVTISVTDWTTSVGTSITTFTAANQYGYEADGRVYATTPSGAAGTITYNTNPTNYFGGANHPYSQWNVIPDPNQINSGGSGISWSGPTAGYYTATFPVITHQQSNIDNSSAALSDADINYNQTYTLPKVLTDYYSAGNVIPSGFLLLVNATTGIAYPDATYVYNTTTSVNIGGIDITDEINAGNAFFIITVGTSITQSVDHLRYQMNRHKHDQRFGEEAILAADIAGWASVAGADGPYVPSSLPNNHAPQYLMREGYNASEVGYNDNNIMLGALGVGSSTQGRGSKYSDTGDSYRLFFGTINTAYLYKDSTDRLWGYGSNGVILDTASNSYDVVAQAGLRVTDAGTTTSGMTYNLNSIEAQNGVAAGAATIGGNIMSKYGSGVFQGLVAGPTNNSINMAATDTAISKWEIDTDGTGAANYSTGSAWVAPRFYVLHYAEINVSTAAGSVTAGWVDQGAYFEREIALPSFMTSGNSYNSFTANEGSHVVLGGQVMVKADGVGYRYWPTGIDAANGVSGGGEQVSWYVNGSAIRVRVLQATGSDFATASSIDLKILLFVAANRVTMS